MTTPAIFLELNHFFNLGGKFEVNESLTSAGRFVSYPTKTVHISSLENIISKKRLTPTLNTIVKKPIKWTTLDFCETDSQLLNMAICHEIGHLIEDVYRQDIIFRNCRSICDKLAPMYVSVYSGSKGSIPALCLHSEAFAETFALYMILPDVLHSLNEDLYHAMNDFYISFLF